MEADCGCSASEREEGLEEGETKVSACRVAGENYLICWDGGVKGSWGWGEKREVRDKAVQESSGEGVLRCQAVAD